MRIEQFVSAPGITATPASFLESVQDAAVGIATLSLDGQSRISSANRTLCRMLGFSEAELIATTIEELTHPEDRALDGGVRALLGARENHGVERRFRHRDGHYVWMLASTVPLRGADGEVEATLAHFFDISARKAAEMRLGEREWHYRQILQTTHDGFWTFDPAGQIVSANDRIAAMLGYADQAEVLHTTLDDHLFPEDREDPEDRESPDAAHEARGYAADGSYEARMRRRDGDECWVEITPGRLRTADGGDGGGFAFLREITDRRAASQELKALAELDTLTGLPNRATLRAELGRALEEHANGVLFFLDLDNFKAVNDSLGHDVGDELLKEVAARLSAAARASDLVARLSGDEFCMLMRDIEDVEMTIDLAERTLEAIIAPVLLGGSEVFVGASLGIARLGHDGRDVTSMLRAADMAMYAAKVDGRGVYRFFQPELADRAQTRLALSSDLRRALERDELELVYQPQMRLQGERVISLEALVRWRHRERGLMLPEQFIGLAEDSGLIRPLGDWVLRGACRQLAAWRAEGVEIERVAVNVSVKQLMHSDFPKLVAAALAESGLPADALELEITESALMDPEQSKTALADLKSVGVSIAIDDFGTGFSSLARLRRLPVDVLKIDRAFTADSDRDAGTASVVRSIIALAHNLGMCALAEGVERVAQRELLLAEGCDMAGGWLWTPALSADELPAWLDEHARSEPEAELDAA